MNCNKCGLPLREGMAFCSNCGTPATQQAPYGEPAAPYGGPTAPQAAPYGQDGAAPPPGEATPAPPQAAGPDYTPYPPPGAGEGEADSPFFAVPPGQGGAPEGAPQAYAAQGTIPPPAEAPIGIPPAGGPPIGAHPEFAYPAYPDDNLLPPAPPAGYPNQAPYPTADAYGSPVGYPAPPVDGQPQFAQENPRRKKVIIGVVVTVAAVLLLALGAMVVGTLLYSSYSADLSVTYVQDGEVLKYYDPDSMSAPMEITDEFYSGDWDWAMEWMTRRSPDGRYMAFLEDFTGDGWSGHGSLCLWDTKTGAVTRVGDDVQMDFLFSADSEYLVYLTKDDELFVSDLTDSRQVDEGVYSIYDAYGDAVLYYKEPAGEDNEESQGGRSFYLCGLARGGDPVEIARDVYAIVDYTWNSQEIVYLQIRDGRNDLMRYTRSSDSAETLAEGVNNVLHADLEESGRILYLAGEDGAMPYEALVDDDLAAADAAISRPAFADYATLNRFNSDMMEWSDLFGIRDYESLEEADLARLYQYMDLADTGEELLELLEEAGRMNPADMDEEELQFVALLESWVDLDFRAVARELEEYLERLDNYEEKAWRDEIRSLLRGELEDQEVEGIAVTGTLYLWQKGESTPLAEDVLLQSGRSSYSPDGNLWLDAVVFLRGKTGSGGDLVRMSELGEYATLAQVTERLKGNSEEISTELCYLSLGGEVQRISGNGVTNCILADDGSVYYIQEENNALYHQAVDRNGNLGDRAKVDTEISDTYLDYTVEGALLYRKNADYDTEDLYITQNGEKERVRSGVTRWDNGFTNYYYPQVYYYRNADGALGDLYFYAGGESEQIASDVYDFYYRVDDAVYILSDYQGGKGDLYLYNGESMELVDYDVTYVISGYSSDW